MMEAHAHHKETRPPHGRCTFAACAPSFFVIGVDRFYICIDRVVSNIFMSAVLTLDEVSLPTTE